LFDALPSQLIPSVAEIFSYPPLLSPSSSEDSIVDIGPITPLQSSHTVDLFHLSSNVQIQASGATLYHKSPLPEQPHQNQISLQHLCPPKISRRPSHDLFECIEQTPGKHLPEDQARYVFAQVVEAVYYLDSQGITHRDIKDENLVIDKDLKVSCLILLSREDI